MLAGHDITDLRPRSLKGVKDYGEFYALWRAANIDSVCSLRVHLPKRLSPVSRQFISPGYQAACTKAYAYVKKSLKGAIPDGGNGHFLNL